MGTDPSVHTLEQDAGAGTISSAVQLQSGPETWQGNRVRF